MKKIKLTQGRFACVDNEDFKWLSQWKWHYHRQKKTGYTGECPDCAARLEEL
jgi:hypothetical protein